MWLLKKVKPHAWLTLHCYPQEQGPPAMARNPLWSHHALSFSCESRRAEQLGPDHLAYKAKNIYIELFKKQILALVWVIAGCAALGRLKPCLPRIWEAVTNPLLVNQKPCAENSCKMD